MIEKTTVVVDGQPLEVNLKPLTMFTHSPDIQKVEFVDDRIATIGIDETRARTEALTINEWEVYRLEPEFVKLFRMVFDFDPPEHIKQSGSGVKHVVGMILLIAEAVLDGKTVHLQYPETHLHPRSQAGLASMIAHLSSGGKE